MIDTFTDSDWAQNIKDRKSVSCIVVMIGKNAIKVQVGTQTAPALSSGEAEYVANVKGGSTGIGIQSMAADFGDELEVRLHTDSTASLGITGRVGLGKIRNFDCALLWLQHHVAKKRLSIRKVPGTENVADIWTKDVEEKLLIKFMNKMGFTETPGRHPKALTAGGQEDCLSLATEEQDNEELLELRLELDRILVRVAPPESRLSQLD